MTSAIFSATIIVGALILPLGTLGKTEVSTTRNPSSPITRHAAFTTLSVFSGAPMRQVPHGKETSLGRIASGYRADLILVAGDPLADISVLRALV